LQLIHGIENEKAAVKAKEEAMLARAVVDGSDLYTIALDKGNKQVIKGLHLLIARTVTNMGLPDRAVESPDLRNLLNYCFAHGNQLQSHGKAAVLRQQKLATIRVHDFMHTFECIKLVCDETRDYFARRYNSKVPFVHVMCDHLDKPEDILGVSVVIFIPRTWTNPYFALCLLPSKGHSAKKSRNR
jgi:hypothetical protein